MAVKEDDANQASGQDNREATRLLREQLQTITGTTPEDHKARLDIVDRIAQHENAHRDYLLKQREQATAGRQWRSNTPLVITLTGLLTIAANFGVAYLLKDQESKQAEQLATTNAKLTEDNARLSNELDEAKAQSAQLRANQTRGLEFQYSMIDKIMSAPPDPDLSDEEVEKLRARQIGFLFRMGLMDRLDKAGFAGLYESLTGEKLESAEIGFPTLPSTDNISGTSASRWKAASLEDLAKTLGERGTEGCPIPLVDVPVPFEMVWAFDETQKISTLRVHEAATSYFKRALDLIVERNLQKEARLFAGVYIPRDVRGTKRPSVHAWGVAVDFDPEGNAFNLGRDQARMSPLFAQTMEEAGFLSHGLAFNRDWMHFELSREALSEIAAGGYVPSPRECAEKKSSQPDVQTGP